MMEIPGSSEKQAFVNKASSLTADRNEEINQKNHEADSTSTTGIKNIIGKSDVEKNLEKVPGETIQTNKSMGKDELRWKTQKGLRRPWDKNMYESLADQDEESVSHGKSDKEADEQRQLMNVNDKNPHIGISAEGNSRLSLPSDEVYTENIEGEGRVGDEKNLNCSQTELESVVCCQTKIIESFSCESQSMKTDHLSNPAALSAKQNETVIDNGDRTYGGKPFVDRFVNKCFRYLTPFTDHDETSEKFSYMDSNSDLVETPGGSGMYLNPNTGELERMTSVEDKHGSVWEKEMGQCCQRKVFDDYDDETDNEVIEKAKQCHTSESVSSFFMKIVEITMYLARKVRVCDMTGSPFPLGNGRKYSLSKSEIEALKWEILIATRLCMDTLADNLDKLHKDQEDDQCTIGKRDFVKFEVNLLFKLQVILMSEKLNNVIVLPNEYRGKYIFVRKCVSFKKPTQTICDMEKYLQHQTAETLKLIHDEASLITRHRNSGNPFLSSEKRYRDLMQREEQLLSLLNKSEQSVAAESREKQIRGQEGEFMGTPQVANTLKHLDRCDGEITESNQVARVNNDISKHSNTAKTSKAHRRKKYVIKSNPKSRSKKTRTYPKLKRPKNKQEHAVETECKKQSPLSVPLVPSVRKDECQGQNGAPEISDYMYDHLDPCKILLQHPDELKTINWRYEQTMRVMKEVNFDYKTWLSVNLPNLSQCSASLRNEDEIAWENKQLLDVRKMYNENVSSHLRAAVLVKVFTHPVSNPESLTLRLRDDAISCFESSSHVYAYTEDFIIKFKTLIKALNSTAECIRDLSDPIDEIDESNPNPAGRVEIESGERPIYACWPRYGIQKSIINQSSASKGVVYEQSIDFAQNLKEKNIDSKTNAYIMTTMEDEFESVAKNKLDQKHDVLLDSKGAFEQINQCSNIDKSSLVIDPLKGSILIRNAKTLMGPEVVVHTHCQEKRPDGQTSLSETNVDKNTSAILIPVTSGGDDSDRMSTYRLSTATEIYESATKSRPDCQAKLEVVLPRGSIFIPEVTAFKKSNTVLVEENNTVSFLGDPFRTFWPSACTECKEEDAKQSALLYGIDHICCEISQLLSNFIHLMKTFPAFSDSDTNEHESSLPIIKEVFSLNDPSCTVHLPNATCVDETFKEDPDIYTEESRKEHEPFNVSCNHDKLVADHATEWKYIETDRQSGSINEPVASETNGNTCQETLNTADEMLNEVIKRLDVKLNENAAIVLVSFFDQISTDNKMCPTELCQLKLLMKNFKLNIDEQVTTLGPDRNIVTSMVKSFRLIQGDRPFVIYHLLRTRAFRFRGFQFISTREHCHSFGFVPDPLELCVVIEGTSSSRIWMCSVCQKTHTHFEDYRNHEIKAHSRVIAFVCSKCHESFNTSSLFLQHICDDNLTNNSTVRENADKEISETTDENTQNGTQNKDKENEMGCGEIVKKQALIIHSGQEIRDKENIESHTKKSITNVEEKRKNGFPVIPTEVMEVEKMMRDTEEICDSCFYIQNIEACGLSSHSKEKVYEFECYECQKKFDDRVAFNGHKSEHKHFVINDLKAKRCKKCHCFYNMNLYDSRQRARLRRSILSLDCRFQNTTEANQKIGTQDKHAFGCLKTQSTDTSRKTRHVFYKIVPDPDFVTRVKPLDELLAYIQNIQNTKRLLVAIPATFEIAPLENIASGYKDDSAPLENITSGYKDDSAPLENIASGYKDDQAPLENIASGYKDDSAPLENIASGYKDDQAPLENIVSGYKDDSAPLENIASDYVDDPDKVQKCDTVKKAASGEAIEFPYKESNRNVENDLHSEVPKKQPMQEACSGRTYSKLDNNRNVENDLHSEVAGSLKVPKTKSIEEGCSGMTCCKLDNVEPVKGNIDNHHQNCYRDSPQDISKDSDMENKVLPTAETKLLQMSYSANEVISFPEKFQGLTNVSVVLEKSIQSQTPSIKLPVGRKRKCLGNTTFIPQKKMVTELHQVVESTDRNTSEHTSVSNIKHISKQNTEQFVIGNNPHYTRSRKRGSVESRSKEDGQGKFAYKQMSDRISIINKQSETNDNFYKRQWKGKRSGKMHLKPERTETGTQGSRNVTIKNNVNGGAADHMSNASHVKMIPEVHDEPKGCLSTEQEIGGIFDGMAELSDHKDEGLQSHSSVVDGNMVVMESTEVSVDLQRKKRGAKMKLMSQLLRSNCMEEMKETVSQALQWSHGDSKCLSEMEITGVLKEAIRRLKE